MSTDAPTYDLVMLLDPQAEEQARAKPLADARAAIQAQGELLRHDEWGDRALAYAINRRSTAEYHLLQFHAGTPELLRTLDRSLRIADEVLRFRIIKLRPGVPEPPDMQASAPAPQRRATETFRPAAGAARAEPAAAADAPAQPESEPAPAEAPAPPESEPAQPARSAPTQESAPAGEQQGDVAGEEQREGS
jgi:small subunit ribosomal protein S6